MNGVEQVENHADKLEIANTLTKYANRFSIIGGKEGIVRLHFGETVIDGINMNGIISIALTPSSLISLKGLLDSFIQVNMPGAIVSGEQPAPPTKPNREDLN